MRRARAFRALSITAAAVALVGAATTAVAGSGNAAPAPLPTVTAFPAPGTYSNTTGVALRESASGADIHYTWDGTEPTASSPTLTPGQQLFVQGLYDGDRGLTTGYTLRAVAIKAGVPNSPVRTFSYTVARRDRTAYISKMVAPGVRMIRDSDNDKMFLIKGKKRYALIDSGQGTGNLRKYVARFTHGKPLEHIFTHNHGDHIGQADQFVTRDNEYISSADLPGLQKTLTSRGVAQSTINAHVKPLANGNVINLGGRKLETWAVPGHTPGSIVIYDRARGWVWTGDSFGNNSPLPPDVLWLQFSTLSIDKYLANVRTARQELGPVRKIFTGHNDKPLTGDRFLDNLQKAMQNGLDRGDAALIPSWRPAGLSQLVVGSRFTNPNWFGANINKATYLPAPVDQIAGLTQLRLTGATLTSPLDPSNHQYTAARSASRVTVNARPSSTRSASLLLDGKAIAAGKAYRLARNVTSFTVTVVAPDGSTTADYTVKLPART